MTDWTPEQVRTVVNKLLMTLNPLERDVVTNMMEGHQFTRVAADLGLDEATVAEAFASAQVKLRPRSRS